ncbi:uncharacterized protein MELLADRAFT_90388 [Melampsora larici-populina 98AG31]|uniref:Uncharacterized protein n=1 Tax=Melampsora larici-populina (strain 98AG31 / pathotype 3-4-7) TaxID=747676 RepID=F4RWR0_MELLP|nr:uncharacterized protein MELLADRAFT_90388 [Melampsora larici-populina 98AG31]EGG03073.1 hypothetical protein MELLADRAFT_90388 [Melampsora larici-populina 98AG31]
MPPSHLLVLICDLMKKFPTHHATIPFSLPTEATPFRGGLPNLEDDDENNQIPVFQTSKSSIHVASQPPSGQIPPSSQISTTSNLKIKIKVSRVPDLEPVVTKTEYDLCDEPLHEEEVVERMDQGNTVMAQQTIESGEVEDQVEEQVETITPKPKGRKNPCNQPLNPVAAEAKRKAAADKRKATADERKAAAAEKHTSVKRKKIDSQTIYLLLSFLTLLK